MLWRRQTLANSKLSLSTTLPAMARSRPCAFPTAGFGCIAPAPISALPPPTISPRQRLRRGLDRHAQSRYRARARTGSRSCAAPLLRHPRRQNVRLDPDRRAKARPVDGFGDVYSVFGTAWRGASGWPVADAPAGRSRGVCPVRGSRALCARGFSSRPADSTRVSSAISRMSISASASGFAASAVFRCGAPKCCMSER